MPDTAFQTMFRNETINGFEARQSLFRQSVTTEAMVKGNQAVFLVADSGGATAVTRGMNGLIPGRSDNLTQYTATLQEWHDKPIATGFNIFTSQGDRRQIMQRTTTGVINRKIDEDIITELNTATQDTGAAQTASVRLSNRAKVILANNEVPFDGNVWCAATPAYMAYLQEAPEFSNSDFVSIKPFGGDQPDWKDVVGFFRWNGVNYFEHPNLPGVGTAAEKCFMYHRSAIGHAMNTADMSVVAGYNEEHDYSFARCTGFLGSKLLQNSGVVVINHDGSAFAAE